jgi:quercetin dioxygenase-like cupin family protein
MPRETIHLGQIVIEFLLTSAETNGALAMFEFSVAPGAKVPIPHLHRDYDETVYVLEGTMTFTIDGNVLELGPGESGFVPRGVVHGFNNLHGATARCLAVVTPALLGPEFFKEVAELVVAGGPPDVEKLKVVYARHGLVPAMP